LVRTFTCESISELRDPSSRVLWNSTTQKTVTIPEIIPFATTGVEFRAGALAFPTRCTAGSWFATNTALLFRNWPETKELNAQNFCFSLANMEQN
jgi:hypothetical protein